MFMSSNCCFLSFFDMGSSLEIAFCNIPAQDLLKISLIFHEQTCNVKLLQAYLKISPHLGSIHFYHLGKLVRFLFNIHCNSAFLLEPLLLSSGLPHVCYFCLCLYNNFWCFFYLSFKGLKLQDIRLFTQMADCKD